MIAAKKECKRVPNGTLVGIVVEANTKFNLSDDNDVVLETVRENPDGYAQSLMKDHEPLLLAACITCIEMGEPMDRSLFLELTNSLIDGKPLQEEVKQWQIQHKKAGTSKSSVTHWQLTDPLEVRRRCLHDCISI